MALLNPFQDETNPQHLSRAYEEVEFQAKKDKKLKPLLKQIERRMLELMDQDIYPSNESLAAFYDFRNNTKITERLVQHYDVNELERHGHSFLVRYAVDSSPAVIRLHVKAGARVVHHKENKPWHYTSEYDECPLMASLYSRDLAIVRAMFAGGKVPLQYEATLTRDDVEIPVLLGAALHKAIQLGCMDIADFLIKKGAKREAYSELHLRERNQPIYVSPDNTLIEDWMPQHKPNQENA